MGKGQEPTGDARKRFHGHTGQGAGLPPPAQQGRPDLPGGPLEVPQPEEAWAQQVPSEGTRRDG